MGLLHFRRASNDKVRVETTARNFCDAVRNQDLGAARLTTAKDLVVNGSQSDPKELGTLLSRLKPADTFELLDVDALGPADTAALRGAHSRRLVGVEMGDEHFLALCHLRLDSGSAGNVSWGMVIARVHSEWLVCSLFNPVPLVEWIEHAQ